MKIGCTVFLMLLTISASAQALPAWIDALPYGELRCETRVANGMKWDNFRRQYSPTTFTKRTFIIQRLDTAYSEYSKFDCKESERPKERSTDEFYSKSYCYRYNNTANFLGWSQGWCEEKYTLEGPVYVSCDSASSFQPKIGFSPAGHFYSYGRQRYGSEDEPAFSHIFTEIGVCRKFTSGYRTRFQMGGRDVYYAPNE